MGTPPDQPGGDASTLPRFSRSADAGIDAIRETYAQRGGEYGDTMEVNEFLTLRAVAKRFLGLNISKRAARILALSGMVDIKHARMLGGYKEDNLIDGGAYNAVLLGELREFEKTEGAK